MHCVLCGINVVFQIDVAIVNKCSSSGKTCRPIQDEFECKIVIFPTQMGPFRSWPFRFISHGRLMNVKFEGKL